MPTRNAWLLLLESEATVSGEAEACLDVGLSGDTLDAEDGSGLVVKKLLGESIDGALDRLELLAFLSPLRYCLSNPPLVSSPPPKFISKTSSSAPTAPDPAGV